MTQIDAPTHPPDPPPGGHDSDAVAEVPIDLAVVDPDAAGRTRRRRLVGTAVGVMFAVAIWVMLGVTPDRLGGSVPADLGDSVLITWILRWGSHALVHDPLGLYDAPIYFPADLTLAYSDMLGSLVPVHGLLFGITGSWAVATNGTVLALLALSLAATYRLALRLSGRSEAALVAAVAYTFSGYVITHWGHIQLYTLGFLPLGFLLLLRLLDERRRWLVVAFALTGVALVTASAYYGLLFAVCATVMVVGHLALTRSLPRDLVVAVGSAGLLTAVLLAPLMAPYLELQEDPYFHRPAVATAGLRPSDLLTPPTGAQLHQSLARSDHGVEHRAFPGFGVAALGVLGGTVALISRARRRRDDVWDSPRSRRELVLLVAAAAVALVLALGPSGGGITLPFGYAQDHLPGFSGIREPARFVVVPLLALAVLAGVGLAWLLRRLRAAPLAVAALSLVAVAGVLAEQKTPVWWEPLPRDDEVLAVYRELDRRPDGVVVELPMPDAWVVGVGWPFTEAPRMLYATIDWNPRVNGYSGFYPPDYFTDTVADLNTFPSPRALAEATEHDVRYVVLHVADPPAGYQLVEIEQILAGLPAGATVSRHGAAYLVDLRPGAGQR